MASILLITGVAISRFGLWMFDLSVTQLMQVRNLPLHQLFESVVLFVPVCDSLENSEIELGSEMELFF